MRDKFFMEHFNIIQKNFRSFDELAKAEALFIRIYKPSLNEQKNHDSFFIILIRVENFNIL
jgi:hypothetical protein